MSLSRVVLSGEVTGDPEKRFTQNNIAVTSFTLTFYQAQRGSGNSGSPTFQACNLRVSCWRNLAEAVGEQLAKGEHVVVEGKLITNTFQAADGVQKKTLEIEATSVHKLPGKPSAIYAAPDEDQRGRKSQGTDQQQQQPVGAAVSQGPAASFDEGEFSEDDIPF